MTSPRTIVATVGPILYSETFIRSHVERLAGVIGTLQVDYGKIVWQGRDIVMQPLLSRCADASSMLLRGHHWQGKQCYQLVKLLKASQAEVVLAEYGPAGVRMLDACRRADVPLVVHFHGFDASKTEVLERFDRQYRRMWDVATAVVVVSRAMRDRLLQLGCPDSKIVLNVYGSDFSASESTRRLGSHPRFLAVGRFVEKKAPHLSLLAFARCLQRFPEARLTLIGDGPLLGICRELVSHLNLSSAVSFLGSQPHATVIDQMASAYAFVQHSVRPESGDSEGTPVAILEACAAGLPVVATRHAGIPDVVQQGVTGLLINERDVDGMAEAMCRLLENDHEARRMGDAGQTFVRERFSMNQSISRLQRILASAAGGSRGADLAAINAEAEQLLVPVGEPHMAV